MSLFYIIFTFEYTHGVSGVPPDSPCIRIRAMQQWKEKEEEGRKKKRRKREKQKGNTYYFLMCLHQLVTKYLLRKQEKIGWLHTDKDNAAVESKEKEEKNKNERKRGREENKSS
jgi:hypothetical protein